MNYAELHCHTLYSNGKSENGVECVTTPRRLLWWAKRIGLSCVAITDHNTLKGNIEAQRLAPEFGVVVIPAAEIDTSERGQILAFGIREEVVPFRSPEVIIADIQKQGGVAVVAHPFDIARGAHGLDHFLAADGLEVCNYGATFNGRALNFSRANNVRLTTGGSDAHHWLLLGNVRSGFPDSCKTWKDYVRHMRYGNVSIDVRMPYAFAMIEGGMNILYTRILGLINKDRYTIV